MSGTTAKKSSKKSPKTIRVPVRFLRNPKDFLHIQFDDGTIRLREKGARRWLEFPLYRLYVLACDMAVGE